MTHTAQATAPAQAALKRVIEGESKVWFAIFAVGFVVFLPIALIGQVLGVQWRSWLPGAEGATSLTGGVKAAVYTFMSQLI
jgi:light-harvesting complex 1 beta chain